MPTENKKIYDYTNIFPIDPRTPIPVLRDVGTTKLLDAKPPIINFNLNPQVREYLANKKQAEPMPANLPISKPVLTNQTTPTPVQAEAPIAEETPEKAERDNLSRILTIMGGGLGAAGSGLLGQSMAPSTQQMIGGLQAIDQREKDMELDNPNSAASIHARGIAKQVFGDKFSNPKLTARQFRESSPLFQQAFDNSFKQKSFEENLKLSKSQDALNWAKFNREKAESDAARAAAGSAPKELKLSAEQEKRLALAKQLKSDYEQLAKMQSAGAESVTGKRADKKEMDIIKNRILSLESVFQQQGQLEQNTREQFIKNLGVGMLDSAPDISSRNVQRGASYEDTILKELSNQTGLDVAVDEKGNKYLVDPRTGQKVRKL